MTGRRETRRRQVVITARFDAAEAAKVRSLAEERGESVGSILRSTLLGIPAPARRRRPRADMPAISRLLAELGRVRAELGKSGSNLNQMAHYLNADRNLDGLRALLEAALLEHDEALRTLLELRGAALKALGVESGRASD